jgi:hypothetical protein
MEEDNNISFDEWGPEKVLSVYDPDTGMRGALETHYDSFFY